jgi:hypothetical protein
MKVSRRISRKVGRRSHSSISRRRLRNKKSRSGYRKKHTQRGGKHGKRSRGHKRGRTYKRGKRFHRGGKDMPVFGSPLAASFDALTKTITNLRYTKTINEVTKEVTKEKYDDFSIMLTTNGEGNNTITFTKTGGDSKFSFSIGPYRDMATLSQEVGDAIRIGRTFSNVINEDGGSDHTDAVYIFKANPELAAIMQDYIYTQSLSLASR